MKKRCKNSEEKNLLPFHIIKAASEGDVMAINTCRVGNNDAELWFEEKIEK